MSNLHPMIVHFPIAFLTIYSLLELARFKFLTSRPWYFYVKAVCALVGAGGGAAAYVTGRMQFGALFKPLDMVDEMTLMHSRWALATLILFALIALTYAVLLIGKEFPTALQKNALLARLYGWGNALTASPWMALIAVAGLACVTVTGALGGAMVYGRDIDPAVHFITGLLLPASN